MTERPSTPARKRRLAVWLAVTAVAATTFVGLFWYTGTPPFCGTCHEVAPSVAGWRKAVHHEISCFDCHAEPGLVGYLKAHVVDGVRDVWTHFTERPDRVTDSYVPPRRCLRCHEDAYREDGLPRDHPPRTEYCPECHRDSTHWLEPE